MEEQLVVLVDPWRDKYDRMLEAHEKLQKLNQSLEEKLLKLAEDYQAQTTRLSHQAQELTQRLVEARIYIHQLEDENDRYRSDINVVVQLLHCKPSNFVSPKLETLPDDLQRKVLGIRNGSNCKKEKKIIKVQVPTFPPTDIMYAVDKGKGKKNGEKDIVSAAIMAKILQERENERKENRKNRCKCASHIVLPTVERDTQTLPVCTISYSNFNFSDFEENDDDDDDDVDEEEGGGPHEDVKAGDSKDVGLQEGQHENSFDLISRQKTTTSMINHPTTSYAPKITAISISNTVSSDLHDHPNGRSSSSSSLTNYSLIPQVSSGQQNSCRVLSPLLVNHHESPNNSSSVSTCGKIDSLSSCYTSVDDIMKPDQKEEELLPTPLFRRKELVVVVNKGDQLIQTQSSCHNKSQEEGAEDLLLEQQLESPFHGQEYNGCSAVVSNSSSSSSHHHHHHHHHRHSHSFPSPSSVSSASPVSSADIPHSSICSGSGADGTTHFSSPSSSDILPGDPLGMRSSSSSTTSSISLSNGNRHSKTVVPGRPVSMNFGKERDRTWEKLTSPTESFRNGLVSHWRNTVLVHHPPKSHSYEPLSLMHTTTTTTGIGEGGVRQQTTTFGVTGSDEVLTEIPVSDEQQPLLIHSNVNSYANNPSGPPSHPPLPLSQQQTTSSSAQYYRAQKRTFWTRSSSTTSTETEI